jgi:hypothetical protein
MGLRDRKFGPRPSEANVASRPRYGGHTLPDPQESLHMIGERAGGGPPIVGRRRKPARAKVVDQFVCHPVCNHVANNKGRDVRGHMRGEGLMSLDLTEVKGEPAVMSLQKLGPKAVPAGPPADRLPGTQSLDTVNGRGIVAVRVQITRMQAASR